MPPAGDAAARNAAGAMSASAAVGESVIAVLEEAGSAGCTADDVASALSFQGGRSIQDYLEDLVAHGIATRRGVSHGALYALSMPGPKARSLASGAKGLTEPSPQAN